MRPEATVPAAALPANSLRTLVLLVAALGLVVASTPVGAADANPALPGRVYADGDLFATRDVTDLPAPTGENADSFDEIFVIQGGTADQVAVAEAAPGETDFNGGRWSVTVVEWADGTTPTLLTSDDQVQAAIASGDLIVVDTGVRYFECPLVPIGH